MEQLIFLLFVLFSIFSAFREHSKRKNQMKEQRKRRAERQRLPHSSPSSHPRTERREEFGEDFFGEGVPSPPSPTPLETTERSQRETLAVEREALEAEQKALAAERRVLELERTALEASQPPRRLKDLMYEQRRRDASSPAEETTRRQWRLDLRTARDAIVYAEILAPPRAERPGNF